MPPRRKENVAAMSGEFLPNLEETHVQEPEQHAVEKLEQRSDMHTAGNPAAYAHISNRLVEELTAIRIEEISQIMSKMMADSMSKVVADCLKPLLSKPSQLVQAGNNISHKEGNQGSHQSIEFEQGVGNSRAGDSRRPEFILPNQPEGRYTPPHKREDNLGWRDMPHPHANGAESSRQTRNQMYSVTNPLYQPGAYDDTTHLYYQGVDGFDSGGSAGYNVGLHARGAQPSKEELEDKDHLLLGNDKKVNQGSDQSNNPETGSGSSKAGDSHRLEISLPNPEESFTPPPIREDHVHMVNNHLYQPGLYDDATYLDGQGIDKVFSGKSYNAEFQIQGASYYHHSLPARNIQIDPKTERGSSKTDDIYRPEITLSVQEEEFTLPQKMYKGFGKNNQSSVHENGNEEQPLHHVVTGCIHQPGAYMDAAGGGFRGVKIEVKARGTQATKEELKNINYCKYHHAFNHNDKNCWSFEKKFQGKMKIKKYWVPKGKCFEMKGRVDHVDGEKKKSTNQNRNIQFRDMEKSTVFGPRDQHISKRMTVSNSRGQELSARHSYHTKGSQHYQEKSAYQGPNIDLHCGESSPFRSRNPRLSIQNRRNIYQNKRTHFRKVRKFTAFGPRNQHFSKIIVTSGSRTDLHHAVTSYQRIRGRINLRESPAVGSHKKQKFTEKIRFVPPARNEFSDAWRVVRDKTFHEPLTKTQKRRLSREKYAAKKDKFVKWKNKPIFDMSTIENQRGSKIKFGRLTTEDKVVDKGHDLLSDKDNHGRQTLDFCVGEFHISVDRATGMVILPGKFKMIKRETGELVPKELVQGESQEEKLPEGSSEVIIRESHPNKPEQVIHEKPTTAMTKYIRPLYMKAHVNEKPVLRVLIDNGSAVNVMSVRILESLSKTEEDLIPMEVYVAAFTRETTKSIGVFPANITAGSWPLGHFAYILTLMSMFLLANFVKIMEKVGSVANVVSLFFIICAVIIHEMGLRAT